MRTTLRQFIGLIYAGFVACLASVRCEAAPEKNIKNLNVKSWESVSEFGRSLNDGNRLVTIYTGNVQVVVQLGDMRLELFADCCVVDHDAGKATLYGIWKMPVKQASGLIQESYAVRMDFINEDKIHVIPLGGKYRKPPEMRPQK